MATENKSNVKHGAYAFLRLQKAPKGHGYLWGRLREFKAALEAEVIAKHGALSLLQATTIQAVIRYECTARLLETHMRKRLAAETAAERASTKTSDGPAAEKTAPMGTLERSNMTREINNAIASRDKALAKLKIEPEPKRPEDWKKDFYRNASSKAANQSEGGASV